jgi:hypothetical protein
MAYFGNAEYAAAKILQAFQDTNSLPKPLARIFILQNSRDDGCGSGPLPLP